MAFWPVWGPEPTFPEETLEHHQQPDPEKGLVMAREHHQAPVRICTVPTGRQGSGSGRDDRRILGPQTMVNAGRLTNKAQQVDVDGSDHGLVTARAADYLGRGAILRQLPQPQWAVGIEEGPARRTRLRRRACRRPTRPESGLRATDRSSRPFRWEK